MRCKDCQVLLEEYFDGELTLPARDEIAAHLKNCEDCAEALRQLTAEQDAYLSYERDITLTPALWVNVRSQIDAEVSRGWRVRWRTGLAQAFSRVAFSAPATVALVLLAILLTVGVMKFLERRNSGTVPRQASDQVIRTTSPETVAVKRDELITPIVEKEKTESSRAPEVVRNRPSSVRRNISAPETAAMLVQDAEKKYLSAIALLNRDVKENAPNLDYETRTKLDGALAAIDRTIATTRAAVRRNPNDPVAAQYMLSAYRKKVDVLREMTSN